MYQQAVTPDKVLSGGGGLYLRPIDMVSLGVLYENGGKWKGKQILSREWVDRVTTPTAVFKGKSGGYGLQWWINSFRGFSARGRNGPYIIVLPEKGLVVVATSVLNMKYFKEPVNFVGKDIIPHLSKDAIPESPADFERLQKTVKRLADSEKSDCRDLRKKQAEYIAHHIQKKAPRCVEDAPHQRQKRRSSC
jgi:CubicO group peptidase (beta-lactamase class C family)